MKASCLFLCLSLLLPTALRAEPIETIAVGAYYRLQGLFTDSKVRVVAVNRTSHRVHVVDLESNEAAWVSPDRLLTWEDALIQRIEFWGTVIGAIADGVESARPAWVAGAAHPQHRHVVAAAERDRWTPAPGYRWVDADPRSPNFAVRWQPGVVHPAASNIRSSGTEGWWEISNGVGVILAVQHGRVVVADVPAGGSAHRAGVGRSWEVVQVGGRPARERTLESIVADLRGPDGSSVEVVFLDLDHARLVRVALKRAPYFWRL